MIEEKRLRQELQNVCLWIKEYVEKAGAEGVVVGNSGGKDSAVVIALAQKALGKDKVITIAMPCSSMHEDIQDARLVANTFEVPVLCIDLTEQYVQLESKLNQELQKHKIANQITKEAGINIKPRLRMTTLYAIAQTMNYLVIGTGNLCERLVGYTTKWGDSASDFNPIANFTVEEVLKLGEYLGVPDKILHKAPNDGLGGLTDEEKMGITYKQIAEYIETGKTEKGATEIIKRKYQASCHKRKEIPTYPVQRENFLEQEKK